MVAWTLQACVCLLLGAACLGDQNVRLMHRQYDGWYNNPAQVRWGSVGDRILYDVMQAYVDRTYKMADTNMPSARDVSNLVLSGPSGLPSFHNNTLLFVFFGQMVAYDIVRMTEPSCPVEQVKIPVSEDDPDFGGNGSEPRDMYFIRSAYDQSTGSAPNNPRKPINAATSYLDGSFIYGLNNVWANSLRSFKGGLLKVDGNQTDFPAPNDIGLPFKKFPHPTKMSMMNMERLWRFGDSHAHQHPGLTAIALIWFRFHNYVAGRLQRQHPDWRDELLFTTARMKVVAIMQNIAMYEWLPQLLRESLPPYTGYKGAVHPGISATFEGAVFHLLHSMIPKGLYVRDAKCSYRQPHNDTALRLCRVYWNAQEALQEFGVDDVIMGMASQIAEREDRVIDTDLRANMFGPMQEIRRDIAVLSIMRSRDHGLPDYNTARRVYGLQPLADWYQLNPQLFTTDPQVFDSLQRLYGNISNLEILPAAFVESTPEGPGPLSQAVLRDQFLRLRDGDRFWFENTADRYFTDEELEDIRNTTFYDVITAVTGIRDGDIQKDTFVWLHGDPCPQPAQLQADNMSPCPKRRNVDYFEGSEVAFVMSFGAIFLYPFFCICVVFLIHKCANAHTRQTVQTKFQRQSITRTVSNASTVTWDAHRRNEAKRIRLHSTGSSDLSDENRRDSDVSSVSPAAVKKTGVSRRRLSSPALHGNSFISIGSLRSAFRKDHNSSTARNARNFIAREVEGRPKSSVNVKILLGECAIEISSHDESANRILNLLDTSYFQIFYSLEQISRLLLFRTSEHPDLCLQFTSREDLELFRINLRHMLSSCGRTVIETDTCDTTILKQLIPRSTSERLLAKCLLLAFAEETLKTLDESEVGMLNLVMRHKISRERLCHLMSMVQDTRFLCHIFSICDLQNTGFISYTDILFSLVYLEKGPGDHIRACLLEVLDFVMSNHVDRSVIDSVVRSLVTLWGPKSRLGETQEVLAEVYTHLSLADAGRPTNAYTTPGTTPGTNAGVIPRGKFKEALVKTDWFDNIGSRFSRRAGSDLVRSAHRRSPILGRRPLGLQRFQRELSTSPWAWAPTFGAIWKLCGQGMFKNMSASLIVFFFYYLCFLLSAERFYEYTVELEAMGLRRLTGYGVSVTRGAAAGMSLCYSVLLLTMCRNSITILRETIINNFVPFDLTVSFHKLVAWTALVFTCVHVLGYAFNIYHLATQPSVFLCLMKDLKPGVKYDVTYWLYENMTGMTGILLVLFLGIMYTFATQTARKHLFNVFWVTHKLFYVIYMLILLHGASRLLQDPSFPYYFLGPAVLFMFDKMVALSRKRRETAVVAVDFLPSDVFEIEFKRPRAFEYKSGQYVRIASLGLNKNEYHPFTLTSAPHETTLTVHIRQVGPWTSTLATQLRACRNEDKPISPMYIDGPYGAGQQDWNRYRVSILIGGGIGVTPYASILKDISNMTQTDSWYRATCEKVYFVWVTPNLDGWEWFVDILRLVEQVDVRNVIDIQVYITRYKQSLSLNDVMLYICESRLWRDEGKSLFTGLQAAVSFGRPSLSSILLNVSQKWPKLRKIGVFSCGTPALTSAAAKACQTVDSQSKATFEHHCENFY